MHNTNTPIQRNAALVLLLIVIFALLAQLVLIIQNRQTGIAETVLRYCCYFTILSIFAVGLTLFFQVRPVQVALARHFQKAGTMAAMAVYITVVAIVYNTALRGLAHFSGLQMWVDELLHVVVPLGYLLYWMAFAPKQKLAFIQALYWLRFPLVYLLAVMSIGALLPSRFYPYPFLDAYNHGYGKVGMAALMILLLFVVLSIAAIFLQNRWIGQRGRA